MSRYVLIGGRNVNNNLPVIEEKVFKFFNLEKPKILFFPFACLNNMVQSYNKFKMLMTKVDCSIDVIYNLETELEKIVAADVLYFGGGHADDLIKVVKDSFLKDYLLKTEKIICGFSAGAIMLSKFGMGDRYVYSDAHQNYNYKMVEGLGLCDFSVCPHYDHNGLWCYNNEVKKYNCSGYALEDDTAIIIDGDKVIPLKQDNSKSIYYFNKEMDYKMIPLYEETKNASS